MKKNKLFLSLTTFCLVLAGVVAAKSNKGHSSAWYYTGSGITHCKAILAPCIKTEPAIVTCRTAADQKKPYFTNSICTSLLHYTQM